MEGAYQLSDSQILITKRNINNISIFMFECNVLFVYILSSPSVSSDLMSALGILTYEERGEEVRR